VGQIFTDKLSAGGNFSSGRSYNGAPASQQLVDSTLRDGNARAFEGVPGSEMDERDGIYPPSFPARILSTPSPCHAWCLLFCASHRNIAGRPWLESFATQKSTPSRRWHCVIGTYRVLGAMFLWQCEGHWFQQRSGNNSAVERAMSCETWDDYTYGDYGPYVLRTGRAYREQGLSSRHRGYARSTPSSQRASHSQSRI